MLLGMIWIQKSNDHCLKLKHHHITQQQSTGPNTAADDNEKGSLPAKGKGPRFESQSRHTILIHQEVSYRHTLESRVKVSVWKRKTTCG